jgi:hypothetical protein
MLERLKVLLGGEGNTPPSLLFCNYGAKTAGVNVVVFYLAFLVF